MPGRSTQSLGVTNHSMDVIGEFDPDPPMSQEGAAVVASLAPEFVAAVDEAIMSHALPRNRKVAMIVMLTMRDPALRKPGLPDLFYAQRVKALVAKGCLIAEGNLDFMRYSEVYLPPRRQA